MRRLVTVVGAGGVGKTQTALAVGSALLESSKVPVWLVELAPVAESFTISAVAQALNVRESADRPLLDVLVAALKQTSLVLVLDNCEHVVAQAAALAAALLDGCPQLRILATSREPLRVAGEQLYRLPSLAVPTPREACRLTASQAAEHAAVLLFVERAKAIDHKFKLSDDTAPVVAEICRRLDGLPLAIELAAARVEVLSLRQMRECLDERFRVLTGGRRDALARQQTIRALIDWSYDLLDEREQALFRRLGIFVNGFTLEGALAVVSDNELGEIEVFDVLASLIDKSLVLATELDGERARYRLLESTRDYAFEKLVAGGERDSLALRHAQWLCAFVEGADATYWTLPVAPWSARFEGELDNLRAALRWALEEHGDATLGGRIASAVPNLWFHVGLIREGRRWIDAAVIALDKATPPLAVAQLALARVHLLDGESRVRAAEYAVRCIEPLDDDLRLAQAWLALAWGHAEMQSLVLSLEASERAIRLLGIASQPGLRAATLLVRGLALQELGRYSDAGKAYREALALYREMGDERRCIRIEIGFAELEFAGDRFSTAVSHARAAAARSRETADMAGEAVARAKTAAYHLVAGEIDEAKREARPALALALATQRDLQITIAIQHLSTVAVLEDDVERAARLRGYVDKRFSAIGFKRPRTEQRAYDRLTTELGVRSNDERIGLLAEAGARLSEDEAVAEALFEVSHGLA